MKRYWKPSKWPGWMSKSSVTTLQKAYGGLSARYRGKNSSMAVQTPLEAEAYAKGRAPATEAVLKAVIPFLKDSLPLSILDVGAGTGIALKAFSSLFPQARWYMIEPNPFMRVKAQTAAIGLPTTWYTSLAHAPCADMVIASYVLNEIPSGERLGFLSLVWEKTAGKLIITLPGTPTDFEILREARAFLLEKGATIIGPCPHDKVCPIVAPDWCHFSVRVPRTAEHRAIKKASQPFEEEKYCYLVISKQQKKEGDAPPRLIKAPRIRKGHVLLDVCQPSGLMKTLAISRKTPVLFRQAHGIKWGMEWKNDALGKEPCDD